DHTSKSGAPKLLQACALPLTGQAVVDLIITNLGVFACDKKAGGLRLIELADGVTIEDVNQNTEAAFETSVSA
ncbi:MAG: CoA-transferase, partial [Pseudomonadota bacterium]